MSTLLEKVNHPNHYNQGSIECKDAMLSAFDRPVVCNFYILNAFKYLWRVYHKNTVLENLKKAKWYIDEAIKEYELLNKE